MAEQPPTATSYRPGSVSGTGEPADMEPVTVLAAVAAFLATPRCNASAHTRRAYQTVLHRSAQHLGPDRALATIADEELEHTLLALWAHTAATTWNRNRAAIKAWATWCASTPGWQAPALPNTCQRRRETAQHAQIIDQSSIERVCTRRDVPLRERLLWRMLYETAARATTILELNIEDLDLEHRRARASNNHAATEWVVWGHNTAQLLPRYLHDRHTGPLFLTDRRPAHAREAATPSRDRCPETGHTRLSYDRARVLIKQHTGLRLHQLRHSATTHLADAGTDPNIIRAKTHHKSLRSLTRHTHTDLPAVATATEQLNPTRRRP